MLYIPPEIEYILSVFEKNGCEAYLVGGCVRDMLTGTPPHDYDITTSAEPDYTMQLFEKTVPTGVKHGTVTVIYGGYSAEVTTYRSDGKYSDSRRPDSVTFVKTLKEDLARRDFTVNALAYSPSEGIKDYFGGSEDIEKKLLRAVGDPMRRFKEDALRILRLFRFSSVLGFEIEAETLNAALKSAPLLKCISSERILEELEKTLAGVNPAALKPLTDAGGLGFLGLKQSPDYERLTGLQNSGISLFAFLYLTGADILRALELLKAPNKTKKTADKLLRLIEAPFPDSKPEIKEMLYFCGAETFGKYLAFEKAVLKRDTEKAEKMLLGIIRDREPYRISDLEINGKELKALGITGISTGKTLEALRRLVNEEPELNKKNILLQKAKEFNRN